MRVVVSALPGSGKTTILKIVKEMMPGVRVVSVGDMISSMAERELGIRRRDELRNRLTIDQQRDFQERSATAISEMGEGDVVIDTHTAVKTQSGYFPGLSYATAKLIRPDVIVFLEYDPKDVAERRAEDRSRSRDADTERQLEEHQEAGKRFAFDAADSIEAAVKIVDLRYPEKEPFEHAKKAADEIVKLFKR